MLLRSTKVKWLNDSGEMTLGSKSFRGKDVRLNDVFQKKRSAKRRFEKIMFRIINFLLFGDSDI